MLGIQYGRDILACCIDLLKRPTCLKKGRLLEKGSTVHMFSLLGPDPFGRKRGLQA